MSGNLSNPKPGHTTGGSRRGGARRGGRAGPGQTGRRRVCPPRKQATPLSPRASKTTVLNDPSEARTNEQAYLSNPKPGHITGGSGRSARRSGRAGSGKIGCQQNYSPRKQKSIVLSKASKGRRFNVSREARTGEILCKPTEEQNQRLTTGLSAVYHRDEKRALFLAAGQWNGAFFVSVNPFHARHVREFIFKSTEEQSPR